MNEKTIQFVREHREQDVRMLALQTHRDDDIDLPWALDQIQGWQTARRKLPSWAAIEGIIYPPHLSMEQCSSEPTAHYKCQIVDSLPTGSHETLIDLTGGFGVDFSFMATRAGRAIYVERMQHLCETAQHNLDLLGLKQATVIHAHAEDVLNDLDSEPASTLIYLDPARRDNNSARTYAIADCTPNMLELKDRLLAVAQHVLIKLSPMLDWHKAANDMGKHVKEIHIVSTGNECKELLLLLSVGHDGEPTIHCVNDCQVLIYAPSQDVLKPEIADGEQAAFLYEPNASIMKAGCFGILTKRYPVKALALGSHLFVSSDLVEDFPGRRFAIDAVTTMNKKELSRALSGITRANVATRNFPMTSQQLRQRLHLHDGGDCYVFATSNASGQRILFICHKV